MLPVSSVRVYFASQAFRLFKGTGQFFKTLYVGSVPELIILRTTFFFIKIRFQACASVAFFVVFCWVEMSTPALKEVYLFLDKHVKSEKSACAVVLHIIG